jgi:hypothetical protein
MSSIVCGCGKPVEERSDRAGQWIACPNCGGTLYSPFPGDKPSTTAPVSPPVSPPPAAKPPVGDDPYDS